MNDEFEKWWEKICPIAYRVFVTKPDAQDIFKAGAAVMREKCVKVAEIIEVEPGSCNSYGELTGRYDCWINGERDAHGPTATAIRKIEV